MRRETDENVLILVSVRGQNLVFQQGDAPIIVMTSEALGAAATVCKFDADVCQFPQNGLQIEAPWSARALNLLHAYIEVKAKMCTQD